MAFVQMAGNGFGGSVQGNYGNYQAASDGTFTVDTRDVTAMLLLGMTFMQVFNEQYTTAVAPTAATVGAVVASGALSNGTIAITANPNVPRPVTLEVGAGTTAITAGTASVTYIGNDAQTATETYSLVCAANAIVTQTLSRGVVTISAIGIAGLTGGASPFFRMSTTAALSLPVSKGTATAGTDVSVQREYDGGATVAIGTLSTSVLASITPTTAPNGTLNYSFLYSYVSPGS